MIHILLRVTWVLSFACSFSILASEAYAQDVVEFLNRTKLEGKVSEIRKADKELDFAAKIGSRVTNRTYRFSAVHAVTLNGKRYVITPVSASKPAGTEVSPASSDTSSVTRSPPEINRIIEQAGKTPPDWYDSVELEYPDTLDLSWPLKAPEGGWNNEKNMGQYIWDIINPNSHRWQSGMGVTGVPPIRFGVLRDLGNKKAAILP